MSVVTSYTHSRGPSDNISCTPREVDNAQSHIHSTYPLEDDGDVGITYHAATRHMLEASGEYEIPAWLQEQQIRCPHQANRLFRHYQVRHANDDTTIRANNHDKNTKPKTDALYTNYELMGPPDGELIICFHGLNGTRASYNDLQELLGLHCGYLVLSFDLFGHGMSSSPPLKLFEDSYSPQFFCLQLARLLQHLHLQNRRFSAIGFSMGCSIAVSFARTCPQLLNRLVLVSPAGFSDARPWPVAAAQCVPCVPVLLPSCLCRGLVPKEKYKKNFSPHDVLDGTMERQYQLLMWLLYVKRIAGPVLGCVTRLPLWDLPPLCKEIEQTPCLILWGSQDPVCPPLPNAAPRAAVALPNSNIVLFPTNSHCLISDNPNAVVRSIFYFLATPNNEIKKGPIHWEKILPYRFDGHDARFDRHWTQKARKVVDQFIIKRHMHLRSIPVVPTVQVLLSPFCVPPVELGVSQDYSVQGADTVITRNLNKGHKDGGNNELEQSQATESTMPNLHNSTDINIHPQHNVINTQIYSNHLVTQETISVGDEAVVYNIPHDPVGSPTIPRRATKGEAITLHASLSMPHAVSDDEVEQEFEEHKQFISPFGSANDNGDTLTKDTSVHATTDSTNDSTNVYRLIDRTVPTKQLRCWLKQFQEDEKHVNPTAPYDCSGDETASDLWATSDTEDEESCNELDKEIPQQQAPCDVNLSKDETQSVVPEDETLDVASALFDNHDACEHTFDEDVVYYFETQYLSSVALRRYHMYMRQQQAQRSNDVTLI